MQVINVATVVSGQINPDWDCPHANHMSTSSKTYNSICLFRPLRTFNWPDTIVSTKLSPGVWIRVGCRGLEVGF